ncbi:MAG: alanine racemase [Alphaproteobacteria bacterium]
MTPETGILTIDLAAVAANYRLLAEKAPGKQIAASIKADAYGLGMTRVAPVLAEAGCGFFYVANMAEALPLRAIQPEAKIAVLHGLEAGDWDTVSRNRLIPVLPHLGAIRAWRDAALERQVTAPVIIFLDTGMNRLGLGPDDVAQLLDHPEWLTGLKIEFWLSHLACSDEPENPMNAAQLAALTQYLIKLPAAPLSFANSGGIFLGAQYHFDQVRPGAALYGLNPTPDQPNPMRPVVRLEAPILQVRDVVPGMTAGYGATWRSKRLGKLAVLPVGYADGLMRSLSNRGHVSFGGHLAPVAGRVSMDLVTVDVTGVPEPLRQIGAMGELIGAAREVETVAREAGTIGYEILTSLGSRYKRVYKE